MSGFDYIVAGLGNPGKKYENTRHNAGFAALDYIAEKLGLRFSYEKFKGVYAQAETNGKKVMLLKPQTYMNLSGESVFLAMSFYKLKPEQVIIIFDDISLLVGQLRVRQKGSHGGHNGMRNISELCKSNDFPRIKIGIGGKLDGWDLSDWVLSKFSKDDSDELYCVYGKVHEAMNLMISGNIHEAMNKFN